MAIAKNAAKSAIKKKDLQEKPSKNYKTEIEKDWNNIIYIVFRQNRSKIVRDINYSDSISSCGLSQISGISDLKSLYNTLKKRNTIDAKVVMEEIIEQLFDFIKNIEDERCAFVTASDVYKENDVVHNILDDLCYCCTPVRVNPNSNNKIRVWIL